MSRRLLLNTTSGGGAPALLPELRLRSTYYSLRRIASSAAAFVVLVVLGHNHNGCIIIHDNGSSFSTNCHHILVDAAAFGVSTITTTALSASQQRHNNNNRRVGAAMPPPSSSMQLMLLLQQQNQKNHRVVALWQASSPVEQNDGDGVNDTSNDDDDDGYFITNNTNGGNTLDTGAQPKSSMLRYVAEFLKQQQQESGATTSSRAAAAGSSSSGDDIPQSSHDDCDCDSYTHLIAIPVDACHELLLELESVQRAVLYHCPVLVHSCIAGSMTRLPLLYVRASATARTSTDDDVISSSSSSICATLKRLVQEAVDKHVGVVVAPQQQQQRNQAMEEEEEDQPPQPPVASLQPVTVQFQTLEIDGGPASPNEVLYTVADPASCGTQTLAKLVEELQRSIHHASQGQWQTMLPPDNNDQQQYNAYEPQNSDENEEEQTDDKEATAAVFRPRIPFMRLPDNWEWYLEQQLDDIFDETFMLTADQGGNGISPVHWGKWCDDVFGESAQRLREVAIYERRRRQLRPAESSSSSNSGSDTGSGRLTEVEFPVPSASVPLPDGTAEQIREEERFAAYQEERLIEAEAAWKLERADRMKQEGNGEMGIDNSSPAINSSIPEDDWLLVKTRERLEKIYRMDDGNHDDGDNYKYDEESEQKEAEDDDDDQQEWSDIQAELMKPPQRDVDPNTAVDDWTRQRIAKVVQSRARVQSELELASKKAKSLDERNPVFEKYKDGTLVPETDKVISAERVLPPFPSREHCTGFWRIVGSPTGFAVEEGDASKSDNLVLRVDGTTAGGPILDQENRQKASGGSWKMTPSEDGTALLRIRLIIPPTKERILVMEGKLDQVSMKASMPLTKNTFGIPALEQRAANAAASDELDDLLICSGSVWIEDAVTKGNRDDVGKFSIMKLNTPTDPSQFTVTIPKNVRNQD